MTTIPTIDNITGNTVMQKFRSLAKLVLDFMTPLYESTEEVIALKPEIEQALADVIEQKSAVELALTEVEFGLQQLTTVMETAVIVDKIQTITAQKTFAAPVIFEQITPFQNDVQITNGHSLSVAGDIDCANNIEADNLIARVQAEIAGMAIEESGLKTVLSNDNGIVVVGEVTENVPTTPPTTTAPVNQAYVESTVNGVNNILHKTGNENKTGVLSFIGGNNALVSNVIQGIGSSETPWYRILSSPKQSGAIGRSIIGFINKSSQAYTNVGIFLLSYTQTGVVPAIVWIKRGSVIGVEDIAVTSEGSTWTLWVKNTGTGRIGISLLGMVSNVGNDLCYFNSNVDTTASASPITDTTTSFPIDW